MSQAFQQLWHALPGHLANHLLISVLPLMLGLVISIPLAIIAARQARLRYPLLSVVSVVQTIPSLALLALMVPVLVGLNVVTAWLLAVEFSALGFLPTVIALTLYSMLPIVRNTTTGILDVDPALKEAALGMGMTSWQSLRKVELPLALPVIIAGIRTATVWTVGIATLSTPVGQRSLGNYIFAGLQTRNWLSVIFGCVAAAVLAMLLDLLIAGLQRAADTRSPVLAWLSGGMLSAVILTGFVAPWAVERLLVRPTPEAAEQLTAAQQQRWAEGPLVIGSKTFTEQYILQDMLAEVLSDAGFQTAQMESLGSTVIFNGLTEGEIDCYVDYTGTIWANYMNREDSAPDWSVLDQVSGWLAGEHQVRCLGPLGFENAYALAMRRQDAERQGIETIEDLAEHAGTLTIGSDYEFFERPEWSKVRDTYGLRFADRVTYNATFMYEAIDKGEVDVIAAFSSDGRIESLDLKLLEDSRQAIPPYDAVILLSRQAAERPGVSEALRPLLESVSLKTMQQANYMVDRDEDKKSVGTAAQWLLEQVGMAGDASGGQED